MSTTCGYNTGRGILFAYWNIVPVEGKQIYKWYQVLYELWILSITTSIIDSTLPNSILVQFMNRGF